MIANRLLNPATLLVLFLVTGCGNRNNPGAPGANPAGTGPLAPVSSGISPTSTQATNGTTSTTSTASTTGTTRATGTVTAGNPSAPVTLTPGDTNTATGSANNANAVGVGLIIRNNDQASKDFRAAGWARLQKKYAPRANFWVLSVDKPADKQQAEYLGWKGTLPTMVVTRGKTVLQVVAGPDEATVGGALDRELAK